MKFSELVYKRPDTEKAAKTFREYAERMKAAKTFQEAEELIIKANRCYVEVTNPSVISEIRYTQNTEDAFYGAEQEFAAEQEPVLREAHNLFLKAAIESRFRPQLEERFGKVYFLNAEIDQKTINPQVHELITKEMKLQIEYQGVLSKISVEFNGEKMPLPKISPFLKSPDRQVRKAAATAAGEALSKNEAQFDEIFDKLVSVRNEIAGRLGLKNGVELGYLRMTRNCYGPKEVEGFRNQVKASLVPLVQKLRKSQSERIGVDKMKFYDLDILRAAGNPAPIARDEELYKIGIQMYRDMTPDTKQMIDEMDAAGMFDLISREGKMTGGYCSFLELNKLPFIFANFNGTADDVDVFTHEGGHAFEAYLNRNDELMYEVMPTYEACEVHSMSMEFLCWPYLDRFYGEQAETAKVMHLISALYFIPYGCLVDEFQHKVYENPDMSPQQRNEMWLKLEKEYFPDMDYDSLPFYAEGRRWQRQLHIYMHPFYYIDYCIAQVCSMQIAAIVQEGKWDEAWKKYHAYTSLGGSMTLIELLKASGFKSPFDEGVMKTITEEMEKYIDKNMSVM